MNVRAIIVAAIAAFALTATAIAGTINPVTFTNNGATVSGASGGFTQFENSSNAGNATLIANGGTNGGGGGEIFFFDQSNGGVSRVILNGSGASAMRLRRRSSTAMRLQSTTSNTLVKYGWPWLLTYRTQRQPRHGRA